jgi:serine protease Do
MVPRFSASDRPRAHIAAGGLLLALVGSLAACGTVGSTRAAAQALDGRCVEPVPAIFTRASPAVVSIVATSINPSRLSERVAHTVGSGFLFDRGGLVLTNSHVVFNRHAIRVTLDDGTALPARIVGADPIFDVAVLRIPAPSEGTLPTIPLADSDRVRVGGGRRRRESSTDDGDPGLCRPSTVLPRPCRPCRSR